MNLLDTWLINQNIYLYVDYICSHQLFQIQKSCGWSKTFSYFAKIPEFLFVVYFLWEQHIQASSSLCLWPEFWWIYYSNLGCSNSQSSNVGSGPWTLSARTTSSEIMSFEQSLSHTIGRLQALPPESLSEQTPWQWLSLLPRHHRWRLTCKQSLSLLQAP